MSQNQTPSIVSVVALALAFGSACNDSPTHDLGYTAGDLTRSEELSVPPVAELSTEFAGTWVGEAEDPLALLSGADVSPPTFLFASGSSRILLELRQNAGDPYVSGTITFGEGALPPATDPDLGYPVDPSFRMPTSGVADGSILPPFEGFAHSASVGIASRELGALGLDIEGENEFFSQGRVVDGKLDLSYLPAEAFAGWCALQTADSCITNAELTWYETGECFAGPEALPMDCQKASQCGSGICSCPDDGSACSYSVDRLSELTIRLSDDGLVGLFSGAVFVNERGFQQPLGTVRFRRVDVAPPADAGAP